MLKKINRVLKLVGLNLVRAKGPRRKVFKLDEIPYDASKHMGDVEWQNIASVPKPGDVVCCREGTENTCIGPEAKVFVGSPNANFVPVDIGVDDHEITRVEQEANKLVDKCCGLDYHPYRVDETPRVKQPNSDNKISGPTS